MIRRGRNAWEKESRSHFLTVGQDQDGAEEMKREGYLEGTLNSDDQLHKVGEEEENVFHLHTWIDGSAVHWASGHQGKIELLGMEGRGALWAY